MAEVGREQPSDRKLTRRQLSALPARNLPVCYRPAITPPGAEARGLCKLLVVAPDQANPEPGDPVSRVRRGRLHR